MIRGVSPQPGVLAMIRGAGNTIQLLVGCRAKSQMKYVSFPISPTIVVSMLTRINIPNRTCNQLCAPIFALLGVREYSVNIYLVFLVSAYLYAIYDCITYLSFLFVLFQHGEVYAFNGSVPNQ